MSIKERLKTAYENVAFSADKTWVYNSYSFQRANQELFSKEYQLQLAKTVELRPRTVKDSIPNSKLARYSNYEYNEARELSYAPSNSSLNSFVYYSREPENQTSKEPWLLPEVDDLFLWFTHYYNFESQISQSNLEESKNSSFPVCRYELSYESPVLKVDTFDKRILKMQITSDRIKNIWNPTHVSLFNGCNPITKDKTLNVYKSPACILYLSEQGYKHDYTNDHRPRNMKQTDFKHLKHLSNSFKEQNCWIVHCLSRVQPAQIHEDESPEDCQATASSLPTRRSYSAVLQGSSACSKIKASVAKLEHFLPLHEVDKESSENVESQATSTAKSHLLPSSGLQEQRSPETVNSFRTEVFPKDACGSDKAGPAKSLQSVLKNINLQPLNKARSLETSNSVHVACANSSQIYNHPSNHMQPSVAYSSLNSSLPNPFSANPSSCVSNYNYQFNSHLGNSYQNNCVYTNTFSANMSQLVVSRSLQTLPSQNYLTGTYQISSPVIMVQQNRTSAMYPISQQYIQQSFYCPNIAGPRPVQRWLQSDFNRPPSPSHPFPASIPPHFIPQPPAHWIGQRGQSIPTAQFSEVHLNKIKNNKNRRILPQVSNIQPVKVKTKPLFNEKPNAINVDVAKCQSKFSTSSGSEQVPLADNAVPGSSFKNYNKQISDFDEVVSKTVNALFNDNPSDIHVPVTASLSDELEIQALEQYCNSTDNVYQELERQAEEQYEEYSENWKSPPNKRHLSGGIRSSEIICRL